MKKTFYIFIFFFIFFFFAHTNLHATPVAVVEDTKFDFGEKIESQYIEHAFKILNKGKSLLKITKIESG